MLLKILKSLNSVNTFLIVPQDIDENFVKISDGWIYDFQLWDLNEKDYTEYENYRCNISNGHYVSHLGNVKGSRSTVCSIGYQNRFKSSELFILNYINASEIRAKYLFVIAGEISVMEILKMKGDFESNGGIVIDKILESEELTEIYASSDIVWALYPEDYDQASGIFGRAVQFGIPVVVRKESILHKICTIHNIEHIALTKETVLDLSNYRILKPNLSRGQELRTYFRSESIRRLEKIFVNAK